VTKIQTPEVNIGKTLALYSEVLTLISKLQRNYGSDLAAFAETLK